MPRMILSLASASALHLRSVGWRGYDSSSVAATQLPRTRCPADRRAVRPASCQATGVGVGIYGLAANTELLVSELVTNAVKTTAGNNDQAAICLQLSGDNTRVLVEVWDADPQPPVLKDLGEDATPTPQEEGGRGLCLIAALSTRWAWYLTEKPTGKVVWCELSAEPPELSESARSAPQALLPRGYRVSSRNSRSR